MFCISLKCKSWVDGWKTEKRCETAGWLARPTFCPGMPCLRRPRRPLQERARVTGQPATRVDGKEFQRFMNSEKGHEVMDGLNYLGGAGVATGLQPNRGVPALSARATRSRQLSSTNKTHLICSSVKFLSFFSAIFGPMAGPVYSGCFWVTLPRE